MMSVVFTHAAGEMFEMRVFHERKGVAPPLASANIDMGMGVSWM